MKTITMYQTYDGAVHPTQKAAYHHLDVKYGDLMSRVAGKLCQIDKYKATSEYIDENLDQFLLLKQIKDDMKLIEDTED